MNFLRKNSDSLGVKIAILLVISLVGINAIFIYGKLNDFEASSQQAADIIEFREQIDMIFESVQKSDLGMRGFFINPENKMLNPHAESIQDQVNSLNSLLELFDKYGLEQEKLKEFMSEVKTYIELNETLISMIRINNLDYVKSIVKQDPGYDLWIKYSEFIPEVEEFLNNLTLETKEEYQNDVIKTIMVQLIILIVGVPALLMILKKINSTAEQRGELFSSIDESNRKFVFEDLEKIDSKEENKIIDYLKQNLEEASLFVKEITQGNYDVSWSGLDKKLLEHNKENLAGNLLIMRDHMKEVKKKDDEHLWSVNGLAEFAEIIRNNMENQSVFADKIISHLVKYLEANQAAFFVVNDQGDFLELKGCYAFDRKKFIDKTISKGQGLAGQCWLEGDLIVLKEVPEDFVSITSGLGEANPSNLIIAPIMADEKVLGIMEIGSFQEFPAYKIAFVEKLCDSIGSSLASIRAAEQTTQLLNESKDMSERLKSQEEELLQNSEELQATQEEMQRKLLAAEKKLAGYEKEFGKFELSDDGSLLEI